MTPPKKTTFLVSTARDTQYHQLLKNQFNYLVFLKELTVHLLEERRVGRYRIFLNVKEKSKSSESRGIK